jgi:hypothetical protein
MIHGFLGWTSMLDTAAQAMIETAATLRTALDIRTRDRFVENSGTPETAMANQQDEMAQRRGVSIPLQAYSQV